MPYGQQQGPVAVAVCCSAGGQRRAQTSKLRQVDPGKCKVRMRQAGRQAGWLAGRQAGRQAGTQTGVQRTQREDTKTK